MIAPLIPKSNRIEELNFKSSIFQINELIENNASCNHITHLNNAYLIASFQFEQYYSWLGSVDVPYLGLVCIIFWSAWHAEYTWDMHDLITMRQLCFRYQMKDEWSSKVQHILKRGVLSVSTSFQCWQIFFSIQKHGNQAPLETGMACWNE